MLTKTEYFKPVIYRSTIQLLRFPFSLMLMPVFLFSVSCTETINWSKTILLFFILHLLVYPSSNGYNCYMDQDTSSIGGVKHPLRPTKQLWWTTILMDILAIMLSPIISLYATISIVIYIACSRMYSYKGIRLKKYPIIGYLTVILNQGTLISILVFNTNSTHFIFPLLPIVFSTLLIGGFYPLTQVYQHYDDKTAGVKTISMLLKVRGTFLFSACIYTIAMAALVWYYMTNNQFIALQLFTCFFAPIIIYFTYWALLTWKHNSNADFTHTMQMNTIASCCANTVFTIIIILNHLD